MASTTTTKAAASRLSATTTDVEQASLVQLGNTHIDDVLTLLDHGLERLPSYRELYLRWERQQWKTQDLDFAQDRIDNQRQKAEGNIRQLEESEKTYASFWIGRAPGHRRPAALRHRRPRHRAEAVPHHPGGRRGPPHGLLRPLLLRGAGGR